MPAASHKEDAADSNAAARWQARASFNRGETYRMLNHAPVAYTYEADTHCPACTQERFGRCIIHDEIACTAMDNRARHEPAIDRENNEVGAIFPWDEYPCGVWCGSCCEEIEPHSELGPGDACDECSYAQPAELCCYRDAGEHYYGCDNYSVATPS